MNTSSAEFPKLVHLVSELDIEKLLQNSNQCFSNYEPLLVFLTGSNIVDTIGHHFAFPIFSCKSLHDFLRIGLYRHASVLVVEKHRGECSLPHLKQLLSTRAELPIEIISFSQINENHLIESIVTAYRKVQNLVSVEFSISKYAEKLLSENTKSLDTHRKSSPKSRMQRFKISQNLIRTRVAETIQQKPEVFLKGAISQIREAKE